MTKNNFKYRIIIPVFNDNKSLNFLVNKIYKITEKSDYHFDLLIIDDHSNNSIKLNTNNYTSNNVSINIFTFEKLFSSSKIIPHFSSKFLIPRPGSEIWNWNLHFGQENTE